MTSTAESTDHHRTPSPRPVKLCERRRQQNREAQQRYRDRRARERAAASMNARSELGGIPHSSLPAYTAGYNTPYSLEHAAVRSQLPSAHCDRPTALLNQNLDIDLDLCLDLDHSPPGAFPDRLPENWTEFEAMFTEQPNEIGNGTTPSSLALSRASSSSNGTNSSRPKFAALGMAGSTMHPQNHSRVPDDISRSSYFPPQPPTLLSRPASQVSMEPLLHLSVQRGNQGILRALVDSGIDINERDPSDDSTALHVAVKSKQEAALRLLLEKGADVNACDRYGMTPTRYAVTHSFEVGLRLLLSHGASTATTLHATS